MGITDRDLCAGDTVLKKALKAPLRGEFILHPISHAQRMTFVCFSWHFFDLCLGRGSRSRLVLPWGCARLV
jgi:hypothetical protein